MSRGDRPASPTFVSITTGLRYEMQDMLRATIRDALELLVAQGVKIGAGERVVVKINLAVPAPPEAAVGTDPGLLRATIDVLHERQAEVVVVEDCDESALDLSGVGAVVAESGATFLNLRERPYQDVVRGSSVYHYAQDVLQADHLISIPN